jgi:hypothetical protein
LASIHAAILLRAVTKRAPERLRSDRKSMPEKANRTRTLRKPPHKRGTAIAPISLIYAELIVMRIVENLLQFVLFGAVGVVMMYALLSLR